jgi:membrane protein
MRGRGGIDAREVARHVWREIWQGALLDRAAGLSYYFLFALFPTLLFLTALLGLLPGPDLMEALIQYAARVLPGEATALLRRTLDEVVSGASGGLLSVGALVALWAASNGAASIITALNAAYGVVDPRPWWRQRLIAVMLTIVLSAFTLAALLLLVFGERIGEAMAAWIGLGPLFTQAWNVLRWPAATVFVLSGITLVYWLAPAGRRRWRWVTAGSLFALTAWLLMSFGLRTYVRYFADYNAAYGSIGGVILLLLWLYLSGVALLVGAQIDAEVERIRPERSGSCCAT